MISGPASAGAMNFLMPSLNGGTGRDTPLPARQSGMRETEAPKGTEADAGRVPATETETVSNAQQDTKNTEDAENTEGKAALSGEEQREVEELKETDRTVRQHEQMHMAVGGNLVTSGPSFEYETGPDGKRYAVSGEVGIDTSKASTPEETVQKARKIRAAALAPAEPSAQDRRVAAMATQMEMTALRELARQRQEESKAASGNGPDAARTSTAHHQTNDQTHIRTYQQMAENPGSAGNRSGDRVSVFA
ncbi:MAG: hypothetical protein LBO79_11140 [Zoogloeaceae bacterium]|jgi:hypothetical protein|nr:hypothetical protein [Zoogloeaceae bacterium]